MRRWLVLTVLLSHSVTAVVHASSPTTPRFEAVALGHHVYVLDGCRLRSFKMEENARALEGAALYLGPSANRLALGELGERYLLFISSGTVADHGRLWVVDISDPLAPTVQQRVTLSIPVGALDPANWGVGYGVPGALTVVEDAVVISTSPFGLQRVPFVAGVAGRPFTPFFATGAYEEVGLIHGWLISTHERTLQLRDPETLAILRTLSVDSPVAYMRTVENDGRNFVFLAARGSGEVQVVEILSSGDMQFVEKISVGCSVSGISTPDHFQETMWVACDDRTLRSMSVTEFEGQGLERDNGDGAGRRLTRTIQLQSPAVGVTLHPSSDIAATGVRRSGLELTMLGSPMNRLLDARRKPPSPDGPDGNYAQDFDSFATTRIAYHADRKIQLIVETRMSSQRRPQIAVLGPRSPVTFPGRHRRIVLNTGVNRLTLVPKKRKSLQSIPFTVSVGAPEEPAGLVFAGTLAPPPIHECESLDSEPYDLVTDGVRPVKITIFCRTRKDEMFEVTSQMLFNVQAYGDSIGSLNLQEEEGGVSDSGVGTIDADFYFKSHAAGEAAIYYGVPAIGSAGSSPTMTSRNGVIGVKSTAPRKVREIELAADGDYFLERRGEHRKLSLAGLYSDGSKGRIRFNRRVKLVSADHRVVKVGKNGRVTAVGEGETEIHAHVGEVHTYIPMMVRIRRPVRSIKEITLGVANNWEEPEGNDAISTTKEGMTLEAIVVASGTRAKLPVRFRVEFRDGSVQERDGYCDEEGQAQVHFTGAFPPGAARASATVIAPDTGKKVTGTKNIRIVARNMDVEPDERGTVSPPQIWADVNVSGVVGATGDRTDRYRYTTHHSDLIHVRVRVSAGDLRSYSVQIKVEDAEGKLLVDRVAANSGGVADIWNRGIIDGAMGPVLAMYSGTCEVNQPVRVEPGDVLITLEAIEGIGSYDIAIEKDGAAPAIYSVVPARGKPGDVVEIRGEGFDTRAQHNLVRFNGVRTRAVAVAPSMLRAIVPAFATNGPVTALRFDKPFDYASYSPFAWFGPMPISDMLARHTPVSNSVTFSVGRRGDHSASAMVVREPHRAHFITPPWGNSDIVNNLIAVVFAPSVVRARVETIATSQDAKIVGVIPFNNLYVFEIQVQAGEAELAAAHAKIVALGNLPEVESARVVEEPQNPTFD